ncbi:NAD-dependent epimerase/dehydratase family protein [Trichococcus ilyis]|uniref:Dihydroflavonol-4-reductase n=1 Tax=Trichococcus ilyis TaxID=640938 RepID=A0A143YT61_9LACT|nr:NAD-dependent epimerase/dehydratase family protein [Trichococcus ilyis]CZQ96477.1 Hypothetical protein TR210_1391 [Trichococcus ilyis]SEJ51799.1 dihydroflavonol-4-reductase [Trichococcus ilyis]
MKKKLFLLTGAAGLLGSNISRQLIEQGEDVRALVLEGDPALGHVPSEVTVVLGDITVEADLDRFFDVGDRDIYVIHSASIVTVSGDYNPNVHEVNVNGTRNMLKQAFAKKVKKFVYISSTSAIPELPNGQQIKEVNSFSPQGIIGFYGQTKAEASQLVMDAVEQGLDASIVFPSGICGPNDFAYGPVSTFVIDYAAGEMKAGIEGSFNAVDVRDLAAGCIACARKGGKGETYIMSNELVSMREMFDLLSELSGAKNVKTILPAPLARILGKTSDIVGRLTKSQPRLTSFAVYNMLRNNNFSSEKAKRELGYKVRPFRDTMRDEILWLQAEGKIATSDLAAAKP